LPSRKEKTGSGFIEMGIYDDLIKKDSQQVITALTSRGKIIRDRDYKLMQRQAWFAPTIL
jgi:hypothetical protein